MLKKTPEKKEYVTDEQFSTKFEDTAMAKLLNDPNVPLETAITIVKAYLQSNVESSSNLDKLVSSESEVTESNVNEQFSTKFEDTAMAKLLNDPNVPLETAITIVKAYLQSNVESSSNLDKLVSSEKEPVTASGSMFFSGNHSTKVQGLSTINDKLETLALSSGNESSVYASNSGPRGPKY